MLTGADKDLVRQCMYALRDGIEEFRTRRPQLEMVAAVANTLACCRQEPDGGGGRGEHIALIEAGSGTGKSFGALIPALVMESCFVLPFSVPDCPLEEARRERIESQWRSPFIEITVPKTAAGFMQQLGRLIRTDEDHGTATILDRRLVCRRWGLLLMCGLPDFELVIGPAVRSAAAGSRG